MDRTVINKYAVGRDSILNIFVMPHHPDSVASPSYSVNISGVMLGTGIKVTGVFENTTDLKKDYWKFRGTLNHEVGHFLGLSHAWINDGCDDTPRHSNRCWNRNQYPGCDTMTSNNVMDYNYIENSWTPCQIGRIQERLTNIKGRARKHLQPNWCTRDPEKDILITDTITWNCDKDLEGNITIASGGELTMLCRVSVPENAKISVAPGATLILNNAHLHNSCGAKWAGIEIQEQGDKRGRVQFTGKPKIEDTLVPFQE